MSSLANSIYANYTPSGATGDTTGVNPAGFKAQSIQSNNGTQNFLQSTQNLAAGAGSGEMQTGATTSATGTAALAPALQYLSQLTKGDQADVTQATQPETNRIQDHFAAVRNMISAQPRGGGKAGQLAEAPYAEAKQIDDNAATARSGAVNTLGTLGTTLTGEGTAQEATGAQILNDASTSVLTQRAQNLGPGSFASQFGAISAGVAALV
jgi:hypothetical protein